MTHLFDDYTYLVLTGNYGSGKTETALNLAFRFSRFQQTTLVDLDIVNPYFRSGEKAEELTAAGIRVLMPTYAMTTVDIPALPAEIQSVFQTENGKVIFDVGGDDTGAAALGRYHPYFQAERDRTCMILVINAMRPLSGNLPDVADLAGRIENRGRLHVDLVINNTNFGDRTEPAMVEAGEKLALACAKQIGASAVMNTGTQEILAACRLEAPAFAIRRYMVPEWMEEE